MTDVWIYNKLENKNSGYTIDSKSFKAMSEIKGNGITACDGLIMLGRETELEEDMRKKKYTLHDYIYGKRPVLPSNLNPITDFYQTEPISEPLTF